MDITQLILDDHHEQRRLFAILEQVDRTDTVTLGAVWDRLAAFLELHAAAEEEIFYPALLRVGIQARRAGTAEDETLDAIGDHNGIRDAVTSVPGHPVGSGEWFAAVAAANLANSDHMGEEEREGLTDFRRLASLQLRHDLAVAWVRYEAQHYAGVPPVDKDPAGYIRAEEERQGLLDELVPEGESADGAGGADGSLSIGSLRAP
ncbi:MAG TPA: hemerythrin domain-containing protein [Streptosporangiaceae bacterium]